MLGINLIKNTHQFMFFLGQCTIHEIMMNLELKSNFVNIGTFKIVLITQDSFRLNNIHYKLISSIFLIADIISLKSALVKVRDF